MVNQLLLNTLQANFRYKSLADLKIYYEIINSKEFDLMDKKSTIEQKKGNGSVTYVNNLKNSVFVIDYEKTLNQFECKEKRCDFIVYLKDDDLFFILNELSSGKISNKRSEAKFQFAATLKVLYLNQDIRNIIQKCRNKFCLLSCRKEKIETPNDIASSFLVPYDLINAQEPQERKFQPVNKYGFKLLEGTLVLIDKPNMKISI